jgi:hypothetical protein
MKGESMFKYIHHITHVVWDLDSVEAYFDNHFDMKPFEREDPLAPKPRTISYKIGPTVLRFSEPGHQHTMEYENLRRMGGPLVSHYGLAVDDIDDYAKELKKDGMDFTQDEPVVSPHGGEYKVIDIAPEGSCGMRAQNDRFVLNNPDPESYFGIRIQLCEDLKK